MDKSFDLEICTFAIGKGSKASGKIYAVGSLYRTVSETQSPLATLLSSLIARRPDALAVVRPTGAPVGFFFFAPVISFIYC